MHFLLTNDDGYGAIGLTSLTEAVLRAGHRATVCAPLTQQSAMSHRFTLWDPMFAKEYPSQNENCRLFSLTGSPVDCVRVGLLNLAEGPVDCVLSGINKGYNSGVAAEYSGTVGAAMEGSLEGLPALALSIHETAAPETIAAFADYAVKVAERYVKSAPPAYTVLNLNAPAFPVGQLPEAVFAELDATPFDDGYLEEITPMGQRVFWLDPTRHAHFPCDREELFEKGKDCDLLNQGYITLTLLADRAVRAPEGWEQLLKD